jgi:hypothetical protein
MTLVGETIWTKVYTFHQKVHNDDNLHCSWFHKDTKEMPSNSQLHVTFGKCSGPTHSGINTAVSTTANTEATSYTSSEEFATTMSLIQPAVRVTPSHVRIHTGNRHHIFKISCTGGVAGVTWMFKGRDLSTDHPCQSELTRKICGRNLYITKAQQSYAGVYTCLDRTTGREAKTVVTVEPEFANPNGTNYTVAVSDSVVMACRLSQGYLGQLYGGLNRDK